MAPDRRSSVDFARGPPSPAATSDSSAEAAASILPGNAVHANHANGAVCSNRRASEAKSETPSYTHLSRASSRRSLLQMQEGGSGAQIDGGLISSRSKRKARKSRQAMEAEETELLLKTKRRKSTEDSTGVERNEDSRSSSGPSVSRRIASSQSYDPVVQTTNPQVADSSEKGDESLIDSKQTIAKPTRRASGRISQQILRPTLNPPLAPPLSQVSSIQGVGLDAHSAPDHAVHQTVAFGAGPSTETGAEQARAVSSSRADSEATPNETGHALPLGPRANGRRSVGRVDFEWRYTSPPGSRAAIDQDNIIADNDGRRARRVSRQRPSLTAMTAESRQPLSTHEAAEQSQDTPASPVSKGDAANLTRTVPPVAVPQQPGIRAKRPRGRPRKHPVGDDLSIAWPHPAPSENTVPSPPAILSSQVPERRISQRVASIRLPRSDSSISVTSEVSSDVLEVTDSSSEELDADSVLASGAEESASSKKATPLIRQTHQLSKTKRKRKVFLTAGLYSPDLTVNMTTGILARNRGLTMRGVPNSNTTTTAFPQPVFYGQHLLTGQREFSLPSTYLEESADLRARVEAKRKPPPYRFIDRNRYVTRPKLNGELPLCQCNPASNCGEDCMNRILQFICSPKICPCGDRCTNIDLGKRPHAKCDVAYYGDRGFGLRTLDDVRKDGLIDEYRGEVINLAEAARRVNEHYKDTGNFYFLEYDAAAGEVLDGGLRGNITRFANHSCAPNCYIEKWLVCGTDEERTAEFQIGLFAARDIKAGEELTYDYGWSAFGAKQVAGAAAERIPQACHCGASNCCGVMGGRKGANGNNTLASSASASVSRTASPIHSSLRPNADGALLRRRSGAAAAGRNKTQNRVGGSKIIHAKKSHRLPGRLAAESHSSALHGSDLSRRTRPAKRPRLSEGFALPSAGTSSSLRRGRQSLPTPLIDPRVDADGSSNSSVTRAGQNPSSDRRSGREQLSAAIGPVLLQSKASSRSPLLSARRQQPSVGQNAASVSSTPNDNASSLRRAAGRVEDVAVAMPHALSAADAHSLLASALAGRNIVLPSFSIEAADGESPSMPAARTSLNKDRSRETAENVASDEPNELEITDSEWSDEAESGSGSGWSEDDQTEEDVASEASDFRPSPASRKVRRPRRTPLATLPNWPLGKPDIGKDGQPVRYNPANREPRGPIQVKDYPPDTKFYLADGRPVSRALVDEVSKTRYVYSGAELEEKAARRRDKNAESARIRRMRKRLISDGGEAGGPVGSASPREVPNKGLRSNIAGASIVDEEAEVLRQADQSHSSTSPAEATLSRRVSLRGPTRKPSEKARQAAEDERARRGDEHDDRKQDIPRKDARSAGHQAGSSRSLSRLRQRAAASKRPRGHPRKNASQLRQKTHKLSKGLVGSLQAGRIGNTGYIPGVPSSMIGTGSMSIADARRARNAFLARVRRFIQRGNDEQTALKMASEMTAKGYEATPLAIARAATLDSAGQATSTGTSELLQTATQRTPSAPVKRGRGRPRKFT